MPIALVALLALASFALGYALYARFLERELGVDDARVTPACELEDGNDFIPTRAAILVPQHLAAISAAGPIVGPIMACLWFGWAPALAWIVLGNVFIGAPHDFQALFASVRHRARSMAQVVRDNISPRGQVLFLLFIWFSLNYVTIAFTDLTASTFADTQGAATGPGVAASSMLYLVLALVLGVCLRRGMSLGLATAIFVPLLIAVIWAGPRMPLVPPESLGAPARFWGLAILAYCYLASVLPLWLLLQPRGFLGGYFLYGALGVGLLGILAGGFQVQYPAFVGWTHQAKDHVEPLFPIFFITIACGACSGFHGMVCGGTTSRQIARESDIRPVAYGGMLLEGVVALISLATVMMLAKTDPLLATTPSPDRIYASGLAAFANALTGVDRAMALSFGLLAFATFIFDTLDVCTRLGRYIFQELTGLEGSVGLHVATLTTLALPAAAILTMPGGAWKTFWPIFGASNQLVAALSLLGIATWLRREGRNFWIAAAPMAFLLAMTLGSLVLQAWWAATAPSPSIAICGLASILILLALALVVEAVQAVALRTPQEAGALRLEA
ncbi:MAG: carbon starvation protein A [Candidatus Wallbacteria bacterium]|nr:carbon starvation protein A [Candidatus Wallbacteria bacterium]